MATVVVPSSKSHRTRNGSDCPGDIKYEPESLDVKPLSANSSQLDGRFHIALAMFIISNEFPEDRLLVGAVPMGILLIPILISKLASSDWLATSARISSFNSSRKFSSRLLTFFLKNFYGLFNRFFDRSILIGCPRSIRKFSTHAFRSSNRLPESPSSWSYLIVSLLSLVISRFHLFIFWKKVFKLTLIRWPIREAKIYYLASIGKPASVLSFCLATLATSCEFCLAYSFSRNVNRT